VATKKSAPKKAATSAAELPVGVKEVKAGRAVKDANIEVKTGLTQGKKYLISVTPKSGRPVLIAVHL
jgi:hypothetical protein